MQHLPLCKETRSLKHYASYVSFSYVRFSLIVTHQQIYLNEKPELVGTVIHPNVLILREEISDEVEEAKDQLAKQSARFVELQRKKLEEPGQHCLACSLDERLRFSL